MDHAHHAAMAAGGESVWLLSLSVFLAGFLGTVMPCTVQMGVVLATLVAQPGGWKVASAGTAEARPRGWLGRLAWFLGGYLGAFVAATGLIAALAGVLGQLAGGRVLGVLGGLALAAIGLQMLGWLRLPGGGVCRGPLSFFLGRPYDDTPRPGRLGASFAVYCAGCCGPTAVGSALLLGQGTSVVAIAVFLLAYAAGMAVPFVVLAGGLGLAFGALRRSARLAPVLATAGGAVAVVFGGLLIVRSLGLWT